MMHDVAEHETAEGRHFRHRKDLLAFSPQRPHPAELGVGLVERLSRRRSRLVKPCQDRAPGGGLPGRWWDARQIDVATVENQAAPLGKMRQMLCERAQGP